MRSNCYQQTVTSYLSSLRSSCFGIFSSVQFDYCSIVYFLACSNQISHQLAKNVSSYDVLFYGNQDGSHCDKRHIEQQGTLKDRSYCPWYYVINHSGDRYPRDIAEARCRCQYGAGLGGETACEQVKYFIRVLRKTGCTNGTYDYTNGWQSVAVGCTLTRAV